MKKTMVFGRHGLKLIVVLLAAALVFTGCAGEKNPAIYAVVDGEEITREEFQRYLNVQRFNDPSYEFTREEELEFLELRIEEMLLLAEAAERGIELDEEQAVTDYENFRKMMADQLFDGSETMYQARLEQLELSDAWLLDLIGEYQLINSLVDEERELAEEPSDEDIEEFYEKEKQRYFAHDERRRVRHILINKDNFPDADEDDIDELTENLAEELYDRIVAGEDFAELAKEYSQDRGPTGNAGSAAKGGDIGFVEKREVVPEFGNAAFDAEVGEVVEPVKSTYGWHIIEVTEVEDAGFLELDAELSAGISSFLWEERRKERVAQLIEDLFEQADITRNFK